MRASLSAGGGLDAAVPALSLFAYGELCDVLRRLATSRLVLPLAHATAQTLLGSDLDRGYRNQLTARGLARDFAEWLRKAVEVKTAPGQLGPYNPDWAVLVDKDSSEPLYFVVETKSSLFTDDLRDKESA